MLPFDRCQRLPALATRCCGLYRTALAGLWQPRVCPQLTLSSPPQSLHTPSRYQAALGRPDAAKECLLKRVRALGGAGWQASRERFATYAGASEALCRAYLQVRRPGRTCRRCHQLRSCSCISRLRMLRRICT